MAREIKNARIAHISIDEQKNAFGEGIKIVERHNIGWAVDQMLAGNKVFRRGWNGKGQWVGIRNPEPYGDATVPYVFISTVQGDIVPWLCSQSDLLAEDWDLIV